MIPKFRAWDKESKEMLPVRGVSFYPPVVRCQVMDYEEGRVSETNLALYDIELMQSTGLKDKNGVEIFEGDFCIQRGEEPYSDENMTLDEDWEYRGTIKFQDFAYWLQDSEGFLKWLGTDCDEIEVIGNIYENPELLEARE